MTGYQIFLIVLCLAGTILTYKGNKKIRAYIANPASRQKKGDPTPTFTPGQLQLAIGMLLLVLPLLLLIDSKITG